MSNMQTKLQGDRAKHWAQQAIFVQDACNLSGVVYSFAELVKEVKAAGADSKEVCLDPCVLMFVDKIYNMCNDGIYFAEAYEYCKKLTTT